MSNEFEGEGDNPGMESTEDAIFGEEGEAAGEKDGIRMERLEEFVPRPRKQKKLDTVKNGVTRETWVE